MCRPIPCSTCGRTTWAGCGNHVEAVRATVPADQWCAGHEDPNNDGWLRRIFGR